MTRSEKIAANKIDKRINTAYHATCSGIQVDIMDLGKIFAVGKAAIVAGADDATLATKVFEYVQTIRKN